MNPKTQLTTEDIKSICRRHGIAYKSHQRITTGFSHEVHRLNDDLVIKLFNKETNKNYLCEKSVLQSNSDRLLKPKLVTYFDGSEDERPYLIMGYVVGRSLGSVWHQANDTQREHLIQEISQTLQAFQSIDTNDLEIDRYKSWRDYFNYKAEKLLGRLLDKKIISGERASEVRGVLAEAVSFFPENEPLAVVYWDIHFDNFIVDDQYRLQAVIDLENVRTLPIDYPLFVVKRQMEQPHKYLTEEDEQYADTKDYTHLWEWYQKYYPEMFAPQHLEERILTYQLLDALHLMKDWSHDAELQQSLSDILAKLKQSSSVVVY